MSIESLTKTDIVTNKDESELIGNRHKTQTIMYFISQWLLKSEYPEVVLADLHKCPRLGRSSPSLRPCIVSRVGKREIFNSGQLLLSCKFEKALKSRDLVICLGVPMGAKFRLSLKFY
jgi:hypothetical protein